MFILTKVTNANHSPCILFDEYRYNVTPTLPAMPAVSTELAEMSRKKSSGYKV